MKPVTAIVIGLTLICVSGIAIYGGVGAMHDSGDPASTAEALQEPENTQTIAVIPTATPTVDPVILQAQATAQVAIQRSLDAQATANAAVAFANEQEAAAKQAEADKAAADAEKAAADERRAENDVRLAAVNKDRERQEQEYLLQAAIAENERLRLENEGKRLEVERERTIGVYAMLAMLAAGLIYTAYRAIVRPKGNPEAAPVMSSEKPDQVFPPKTPIGLAYTYPGGVDIRPFDALIPRQQLATIAAGYLVGVAFTHKKWTPSVLSEGKFASLQHLMVKNGLANWEDEYRHQSGVEITEKGEKFFEDVCSTTSPLPEYVPPKQISRQDRQTDAPDGYDPVGEGVE